MKNLNNYLQESLNNIGMYESLRIGINDSPEEEFVDYTNIDKLYLVRILPKDNLRSIELDVITNLKIMIGVSKPTIIYDLSGDFKFDSASYRRCAFTLNSSGILTRWLEYGDFKFFDILLPFDYLKNFKEFVKSFDDENITYYIEEVLDALDIDCDEIPDVLNGIEYTLYNKRDNFEKLKQYLNIN